MPRPTHAATVSLRPSVVSLAELRASGPAAESVAPLVVDADVAPDACGLPRDTALAVFWPLVAAEEGDVARIVASRAVTLRRADEDGVPVGLRAELVAGGAVRVHPLVAMALAEGRELDAVAVRGLWSDRAVGERAAMAPWRMPRDAAPTVTPGARLGLWTLTRDGDPDDARVFANADELMAAWEEGIVAHDAVVRARIDGRRVNTTAGRVWLWRALPPGVPFAAVDRAIDVAALPAVIAALGAGLDAEARWRMLAALDDAGSRWLARSGRSVGLDDLRPSEERDAELATARERVREVGALYDDGLVTETVRYVRVVDAWAQAAVQCRRAHDAPRGRDALASWRRTDLLPTAYRSMQLTDFHGLVTRPSEEVYERPVLGAAARGYDAHDTMLRATTAREASLRTAARHDDARGVARALAGALVRQRVTVEDCGTTRGALVCPWTYEERDRRRSTDPPTGRWTAGRVLAEDVRWGDGALLAAAGTTLDAAALLLLRDAGVDVVRVRSPRGCAAAGGVCARCWGHDEAGAFPAVGEAVGAKALLALWRTLARATVTTYYIC